MSRRTSTPLTSIGENRSLSLEPPNSFLKNKKGQLLSESNVLPSKKTGFIIKCDFIHSFLAKKKAKIHQK